MVRRKLHSDYAILIHNHREGSPVQIRRAQSLSITGDMGLDAVSEISNKGVVEWKPDTVSVSGSFTINLTTDSPFPGSHSLYWLGLLADKKVTTEAVSGSTTYQRYNAPEVFGIGRSFPYYPEWHLSSGIPVHDFDFGMSGFTTQFSLIVPTRGDRNNLDYEIFVPRSHVTSLSFSFGLEGADVGIDLESDLYRIFTDDAVGFDIVTRFAGADEESSNQVRIPKASNVIMLLVDNIPHDFSFTIGASDTVVSPTDYNLKNGDVVDVLYIPFGGAYDWTSYKLASAPGSQGIRVGKEIEVFVIKDTTTDRIIHGFYPVRSVTHQSPVVDGKVALATGRAKIDSDVYLIGVEEGVATGGSMTTLEDTSRTEADGFWNGATITILTGQNAGITRRVSSFSGGTFTFSAAFPHDISSGDKYRINAQKVVANAGDNAIYAVVGVYGTADGGTTSSFTDAGRSEEDDYWNNTTVTFLTGSNAGTTVTVTDFSAGTFTFDPELSLPISAGDQYVINVTWLEARSSAPSSGVKIADITTDGSGNITSYSDARDRDRQRVLLAQSVTISCDLTRETINELGNQYSVARSLNLPLSISTEISALDKDGELVTLFSGGIWGKDAISLTQIDFESLPSDVGLQVVVHDSDEKYDHTEKIIFEVWDNKLSSLSLSASTGASGEASYTLIGDNLRIFWIS